jgi:SP family general alpha glucoside:H+ symporter-like MFS transporter
LIADQVGFKIPVIGALGFGIGFTLLLIFALNLPMLLVGQLLSAMTWGLFQILANSFAAEICTNDLRPYLCTLANAFLVFGQLLGAVVTRASVTQGNNSWAWKVGSLSTSF